MEEIPQGGAGGVPPHHATDDGEGGHGLRARSGADGDATTAWSAGSPATTPGASLVAVLT
ncbi:hypothetical protein GCM10009639_50620 [Kitasatospora putterlickiae]|uniref:Uncharacterized protein n=1 Tax=Kitasatospora putterlickiae TaxID=221725 RepID=A0ABN1YCV0_9ACTN